MEREPTVRWRKVWISWGIYWAAASKVPVRPRKAAQREMRRREEEPKGAAIFLLDCGGCAPGGGKGIGAGVLGGSSGLGKALSGRLETSNRVTTTTKRK